jgi:hypothetical protein
LRLEIPFSGHRFDTGFAQDTGLVSGFQDNSKRFCGLRLVGQKKHGLPMLLRSMVHIAFLCVLALGFISQPNSNVTSHIALSSPSEEMTRHAALAPVDVVEHGHSHDDGEPYEKAEGHAHGHDPADHSHQIAFVSVFTMSTLQLPAEEPVVGAFSFVRQQTGFGIDRPPKHMPLA